MRSGMSGNSQVVCEALFGATVYKRQEVDACLRLLVGGKDGDSRMQWIVPAAAQRAQTITGRERSRSTRHDAMSAYTYVRRCGVRVAL